MTEPSHPQGEPTEPSATFTFAAARRDNPMQRLGWSDGVWSGHPACVTDAEIAVATATPVLLTNTGPSVPADDQDPVVAAAVIRHVLGSRLVWTGTVPDLPQEYHLTSNAWG